MAKQFINTDHINDEIAKRFTEALEELKRAKQLKYHAFCIDLGINRFTLWGIRKGGYRGSIELAWLSYLITEYGVNPEWLMTGKGSMFGRTAKSASNLISRAVR